ncbi:accessory Sec system protein Asp3 [Streptococcus sp. oral taxon 056 str. F0418]|uniref:accessory Sec system protein Asp3 n=1 Tax=Streptococcus sp. oral taxon 056 TaxID=712620 RepID=UPI0002180B83|nr:accessory Sec system protein Asp3 [Streptococcus sp. oral taxon 056]EGP66682.1 accessory Sec system protein Asp3 [Streptococcus sp. oral taxon 056 str. F0418]
MRYKEEVYSVYWDMQSAFQYLYGSSVKILDDGQVLYENQFMPSGTVIHDWHSAVNYQGARNTNQLPQLKCGHQYKICVFIETKPENSSYLKVEFLDALDETILSQIIKQDEIQTVTVPDNTHHYKIQLVSSGCHRFLFDCIDISEVETNEYSVDRYWISDLLNIDEEHKSMYVCFTEPDINRTGFIKESFQKQFPNLLLVNTSYKRALLYMEIQFFEMLLQQIESLADTYRISRVVFVGYGPISNIAALYYSKQFSNAYALITDDFLTEVEYQTVIDRYRKRVRYPVFKELLLHRFNPQKVMYYVESDSKKSEFANFDYLLEKSFLLQKIQIEQVENWITDNEI